MWDTILVLIGLVIYGVVVAIGFIHIVDKSDHNMRFRVTYLDLILMIIGLPFTILVIIGYYGIDLLTKLCDLGMNIGKSTNKFIQKLNQPIIKEKGRN